VRRLLRIAFNVLTVLSLVLAVLVAGLWVRSYWRMDTVAWLGIIEQPEKTLQVGSYSAYGWVTFQLYTFDFGDPLYLGGHLQSATLPGDRWRSQLVDSGYSVRWDVYDYKQWPSGVKLPPRTVLLDGKITVRWWNLLLLAMLLPMTWAIRKYQEGQRLVGNFCPTCGYDLRATPDRCPECGAVPAR
jgi:hypothetical protein